MLTTSSVLEFDSGVSDCVLGGTYPDDCLYNLVTVTSGSWFAMDNNANSEIESGEKTPIQALAGIHIGSTSIATGSHSGPPDGSENPAFDVWEYFGNTGMDYVSSPITQTDDFGTTKYLDFSGWSVTWGGVPLIPMSAGAWNGNPEGKAVITCSTASCSASSTFTLDYSAIGVDAGYTGVQYALHLEGTVSAVPIPATAWLFGSGLLGLLGMARRRKST